MGRDQIKYILFLIEQMDLYKADKSAYKFWMDSLTGYLGKLLHECPQDFDEMAEDDQEIQYNLNP